MTARHIHLDPQPMRRETVRATDIPDDDPTAWLVERVRAWAAPDQIFQLRLEGPLKRSTYQAMRFLEVWQVGNDLSFYFDLDRHLLTVREDEPIESGYNGGERVSVRGEIDRVAAGLSAAASSDDERALIDEARAKVLERYGTSAIEDG